MVEEVKSKITEAFHHFNKKDGIDMNKIKVKIVSQFGVLAYSLMNGDVKVRKTEFDEMINIGFLFQGMAKTKMQNSVNNIINDNGLSQSSASIIIFPNNDNSPIVHLYKDGEMFKEIEIENLIN